MFTAKFWRDAFERAVKTAAQVAAGALSLDGLNLLDVNWSEVGGLTATGFVLSVLTSLASEKISPSESGSILKD